MKKATMRHRLTAAVLSFVMIFTLLTPYRASAEEAKQYAGYVYFTVEKLTLGQGFVVEPVKVGVENGETLASLTQRVLGAKSTYTGDLESYYLTGVIDGGDPEGWTTAKIPEKTVAAAGGIDKITSRAKADTLSAYDFTEQSGWMHSLNNAGLMVGANGYTFGTGETSFKDGDVIRLQFSVYGWGADTNMAWDTPIFTCGNKDILVKALADYSSLKGTAEYKTAYELMEKMEVTDAEMEKAALALKVAAAKKSALDYLAKSVTNPTIASVGGEWAVLALARGEVDNQDFYSKYINNAYTKVKSIGKATLDENKGTENSRVVIALRSIGADPKTTLGYDLTEPLKNYDYVIKQGLSGAVYGLIALNTGDFGADDVKSKLVAYILEKKTADGGWTFYGDKADPDMTAMVLMALAPYYDVDANVKAAADTALALAFDVTSSESAAQLICAYAAYNKADKVAANLEILLKYQDNVSGGYCHEIGKGVDAMASEQAAYALVAADRMLTGKSSLFDMKKDQIKAKYVLAINAADNKTGDAAAQTEEVKSFTVKNIKYKVLSAKAVSVTGLKKAGKKSVTIPAKVTYKGKTYKVTKIAAKAFKDNKKLTKITLGKNVTEVGKAAFQNCRKLKKVTVKAKKLKKIGKNAFKGTKVKM